jgi:hypothetical protein
MIGYIAATTVTSNAARNAQSMSAGRMSVKFTRDESLSTAIAVASSDGFRGIAAPLRSGVCSSSLELPSVSTRGILTGISPFATTSTIVNYMRGLSE